MQASHSRFVYKQIILIASGLFVILLMVNLTGSSLYAQEKPFSMQQVLSYPFPSGLTVASTGARIAWTENEEGLRNIYVAEGPGFKARRLTSYEEDDGQELSSVSLSSDGKWCVYIRGGDFGANWDDAMPVNGTHKTEPPKVQIWSIPFAGGTPHLLGEGTEPVISPRNDTVVFVRSGQLWNAPVDGSARPQKLFSARGHNDSPRWSPDGTKLAFRSMRQDHAFIGIFSGKQNPIIWIDPSYMWDSSPRWSKDGERIAFIRQPGRGGAPDSILVPHVNPWMIMTANPRTGKARMIWHAPYTLRGSFPATQGHTNLHWANNRIVFLSYHDGWPHLYSIPEERGKPLLLTPGNFMAEYISLSADGKTLVFAGNTGNDPLDIERRHIIQVSVDKADIKVLTPGIGLEWTPFITGDGKTLVYISATGRRPPMPAVMNLKNHKTKLLAANLLPDDFPTEKMVVPVQVIFHSTDGTPVHATLFKPAAGAKKKPAVIFVHGGPPRQMLLGWHYSSYYSNAYAINQYLVNHGFVVLSVNYRLGIGYSYEFHHPLHAGTRGASEYQDIKSAGEWLATRSFVDPTRIGIYGGSYGGYLTALALGRNSDIFAAGVDISGVHDRTEGRANSYLYPNRYEHAPDGEQALKVAWESSPVSGIDTWTSPVLVIHGDDDRNVHFSQSVDLVQRLIKKGVSVETLVIVDDTHHFLVHANQLKVNEATAEFLIRHLTIALPGKSR